MRTLTRFPGSILLSIYCKPSLTVVLFSSYHGHQIITIKAKDKWLSTTRELPSESGIFAGDHGKPFKREDVLLQPQIFKTELSLQLIVWHVPTAKKHRVTTAKITMLAQRWATLHKNPEEAWSDTLKAHIIPYGIFLPKRFNLNRTIQKQNKAKLKVQE